MGAKKREKATKDKEQKLKRKVKSIERKIASKLKELEAKMKIPCYPFLGAEITKDVVCDVFDDLRKKCSDGNDKLMVLIDSGGGDIHAAFNLASLFRKFSKEELIFVVPRWAKSAATLLVCGGNKILMTPVAELGPLDPQITEMNPFEQRFENFSPLHVSSTLDLIRKELNDGNKELAGMLVKRLQFPLTLGSFVKAIDIGRDYLGKLLKSRMLKGIEEGEINRLAEKLTTGYADHGFCINFEEARNIGLVVEELTGGILDLVWEIYRLYDKKRSLEQEFMRKDMEEILKDLLKDAPDLKFPKEMREGINKKSGSVISDEQY